MMEKRDYVLSQAAEEDLMQIFEYTELEFGMNQAAQYLLDIEQTFYRLCDNPLLGRERQEIRDELRAIPCGSHIIFYRTLTHHIRIVRILHASRDLHRFFNTTE